MAIDVPTRAAPQQAPALTAAADSLDMDERWAAWRAKGAAHDRAVRRKMAIGAPIVIVVATAIVYALLGR